MGCIVLFSPSLFLANTAFRVWVFPFDLWAFISELHFDTSLCACTGQHFYHFYKHHRTFHFELSCSFSLFFFHHLICAGNHLCGSFCISLFRGTLTTPSFVILSDVAVHFVTVHLSLTWFVLFTPSRIRLVRAAAETLLRHACILFDVPHFGTLYGVVGWYRFIFRHSVSCNSHYHGNAFSHVFYASGHYTRPLRQRAAFSRGTTGQEHHDAGILYPCHR